MMKMLCVVIKNSKQVGKFPPVFARMISGSGEGEQCGTVQKQDTAQLQNDALEPIKPSVGGGVDMWLQIGFVLFGI